MNRNEDLLFGTSDTQESIDDLWQAYFGEDETFETTDSDYESDDDLFNTGEEVTTAPEQSLDSPLPRSEDTSITLPGDILMPDVNPCSKSDSNLMKKSLPGDRWCGQTRQIERALTTGQALGDLSARDNAGSNC